VLFGKRGRSITFPTVKAFIDDGAPFMEKGIEKAFQKKKEKKKGAR